MAATSIWCVEALEQVAFWPALPCCHGGAGSVLAVQWLLRNDENPPP